MKKKIFLLLITIALCSSLTMAGKNYGAAGCGPGSMIVGGNGNQFLAMIIDDGLFLGYIIPEAGLLGTIKTFAISTGTSNCKSDGVALSDKEQEQYVDANFESLMQEMAQGEGEHLDGFQSVLQCDADQSGLFANVLKENYQDIFPAKKTNSKEVLNSVKSTLKKNETLTQSCKLEEV